MDAITLIECFIGTTGLVLVILGMRSESILREILAKLDAAARKRGGGM